ncbi:MAG: tetratricopeptide repeat protein [Microscillaceae bacterium]|nr:tetratricopeptide repeat protein [Microscillaceae bacterium]
MKGYQIAVFFCFIVHPFLYTTAQDHRSKEFFDKGEIELHVGEFKEAIKYYSQAIQSFRNYKDAYFSRAKTFLLLQDSAKALKDFESLLKLDSNQARAHFYIGVMAYNASAFERSIQSFDRAIAANPNYALAYNYRASAYKELGLTAPAIDDYSRSIQLDPQVALLYFGRGKCYLELEDYQHAILDFDKAIELEPRKTIFRQFRAETNFLQGNYFQASQDIDMLQKLTEDPLPTYYHSLNAFCKAQNNNFEGAIESMNKVIQDEQDKPENYAERASYQARINAHQEALADYQKALSLDSDNVDYQIKIARIYFKLKNYPQTIKYVSTGILADGSQPELWYLRGTAYLAQNKKKEAKFDLGKAASLGFPAEEMSAEALKYAKKYFKSPN